MVNAYTGYKYTFADDPILLEDTIDNLNEYLPQSLNEFNLQDLFRIRQQEKLHTEYEYYLDVNNRKEFYDAIIVIKFVFCARSEGRLKSKIIKRLKLKKDERPNYFNNLWKIYYAAQIVHDWISNDVPMTTGNEVLNKKTDEGSIFSDAFKSILFDSIDEINDDDFAGNIHELESFIEYSLNKMDVRTAADTSRTLLGTFSFLQAHNSGAHFGNSFSDRQDSEFKRKSAFYEFTVKPMLYFVNQLLLVHDEYGVRSRSIDMTKKTRPSIIWESLSSSGEPYPRILRNEEMFHLYKPDFLLTLIHSNHTNTPICGIDMECHELSKILESNKIDNFAKLSKIFREVVPFQIFNKFSSYIISDFNMSLYFEYPLGDGKWWSNDEDEVHISGAPVKFKLFDNSGTTPADRISLQLLLILKFYDTIRRVLPVDKWLKVSNGEDILHEGSYRLLDQGWNEKVFNPFIISQFRYGFKKKIAMDKLDRIPVEATKFPLGNIIEETGNAPKRLKVGKESFDGTSPFGDFTSGNDIKFDTTKLFPINTNLKVSNHEILNEYSNTRGTKLIIEGFDIFKSNTNISNKVFFKMFDLANLKYLHSYVKTAGMPYYEEDCKGFTDSEICILFSLEDCSKYDFKHFIESLKKSYIREITALKKIKEWNSKHGIKEQINSPKLLQHGWTYLELLTEGQVKYSYWGPFICTEYLDFIKDNEYKDHPKRTKNLNRQLEILSKAGIEHNNYIVSLQIKMNDFPGGFPGMYDDENTGMSNEQDQTSRTIRSTPEFEAVRKSLKSRKKILKKDIINSLDIICTIGEFYILVHQYNKAFTNYLQIILVFQTTPILQQLIPRNAGKRSTFHIIVISNFFALLLHLTRELPIPNEDGYLYGHHFLQTIGQQQLPSKYWFIPLDLLVFYMQVALFTSQYSTRKNKTIKSTHVENEHDGFQGETIALKIPIISALHMPFPSVEVLKTEEEEMNNSENATNNGNLLASQAIYGSIPINEEDDEESSRFVF
ncbi:hypothetical protein BN7_3157 [Wickerhamomyces ciferrii]|uniref:DUF1746 domain-containing protein n=1 Tax=Wickerhamomyces ciferrii (strain ATCC 14091 / BCRC 22168 / CBS 111 / JCM 3599 / NBRC 0793 / NRRL Y-1031 F-60-10) TaxID=1206466 RepID=K0KQD3_WICCF|nr:uncharacterized protein BN7_3157 [Wickerhamomyces ciferrii]CCH43604.1 hypothetical protein BN7_3157 [Wickerhamomyces ciferrii]